MEAAHQRGRRNIAIIVTLHELEHKLADAVVCVSSWRFRRKRQSARCSGLGRNNAALFAKRSKTEVSITSAAGKSCCAATGTCAALACGERCGCGTPAAHAGKRAQAARVVAGAHGFCRQRRKVRHPSEDGGDDERHHRPAGHCCGCPAARCTARRRRKVGRVTNRP